MDVKNLLKMSLLSLAVIVMNQVVIAQTNLALTATAAHSGGGATTYAATNYNDNTWSTCTSLPWGWVSTNGWIEYTWGTSQTIAKVVFYKSDRPMTTCTIEYWNGSSYTTIMSYSGTACDDSVTFTPVTTTQLRFNTVAGSSNPNHREILVYGPACSTKINVNPVPKVVCQGKATSFIISATDAAAYQWQVDEGSGFINVNNSANYAGATTNKLDLSNIPASFDGNKYRCKATKATCKDSSSAAVLTVNKLVSVNDLPPNDTTCIDANTNIEAIANGTVASYKWQIFVTGTGYVDLPIVPPYSLNGNKLNIAGVPDTLDGAMFRCIVNGVCDTAVSSGTRLTVSVLPTVAVPPADVFAEQGDDVKFEVQASAAGAKYQWQVAAPDTFVNINDGGIYQGVKTSTLYVKTVSRVQNNFKFRCIVGGSTSCIAPGDTSNFALLTVNPPASVSTLSDDGFMMLYPNPTGNSSLFIKTSEQLAGRSLKYKITDKTGRTILVGNVNSQNKTSVDVGKLPADIYLVEILDEGNMPISQSRFTKL